MKGYKLEPGNLGFGAFGSVIKATRKKDGKVFCMKISNEVYDDVQRQLLEDEADILSKIQHPNIIQVIDGFWYNRKFCLVMEFADGGNLLQKVKEQLSESEIIKILIQILNGLQYLHSQKIMHRDLKPENILLMQDGQVKIADFGFAKFLENTLTSRLTFAGTPQYIAPEMYLNEPRGIPCDIWSLGVIIYLFATQHLPFSAQNQEQLKQNIINCDPPPIGNKFFKQLNEIVVSMLNKKPQLRPTAEILLKTLQENENIDLTNKQQQSFQSDIPSNFQSIPFTHIPTSSSNPTELIFSEEFRKQLILWDHIFIINSFPDLVDDHVQLQVNFFMIIISPNIHSFGNECFGHLENALKI